MKKLLLSATAFLSVAISLQAQQIQPCGTYQARDYFIKNLPGYAAKLNAAEAAAQAEYQAFLQKQSQAAKTSSLSANYTFTVPVVFHILHQGEALGTGANINDINCINALAQVNRDYAREGSDTNTIDPKFRPLYVNSHIQFMLAQKDPMGNCTNGIVHHYDDNTQWSQGNVFNYQYSTYAAGNWNPSKYLNIYIVDNIISAGSVVGGGIIVGYTYLPGTSPVLAADAIVYRNNFLGGLGARALSHEIGHWFGLSHTFGSTNDPGFECGNDDIYDTPVTTGFFSTCPKPGYNYTLTPSVATPVDSSDITRVKFGKMDSRTPLNSSLGFMIRNLHAMVATTVTPKTDTIIRNATGTTGGYSNFTEIYGNDFNAGGAAQTITITSVAKATDNNYVGMYIDYNKDGDFVDGGENIFTSSAVLFGTQTFTASHVIPASAYSLYRMRVITSNVPVTGATTSLAIGEFEEYNLNIGITPTATTAAVNKTMATCDTVRPNIENIMDYSDCPKMFTQGQTNKVRLSAESSISNRNMLVDSANLVFTGILDANFNPVTVSPCAPVADFAFNKTSTCEGQAILFTNTAYNGTGMTYSWEFEGGTPSTSTLAAQSVTYSTAGTYSVSLTVTNAYGVSTKTINTIQTTWNAPSIALPYMENFDNGQWWPAGWVVPAYSNNLQTPTWELSSYGAGNSMSPTSAHSLLLPNANMAPFTPPLYPDFSGNVDYIETPAFDFSNVTSPSFAFDYSFARKTGVVADTFKVQYSLDCGGTWKQMPSVPTTSVMASSTGGTVNAAYIPWSGADTITSSLYKWKTVTIANVFFSGLVQNERSVRFRFWFKNDNQTGMSQNLYIDNVNISGTVGIREFENSIGLAIYPNPTSSASTVEFTSPTNSKVNVLVYDVTGRTVEQTDINATAGVMQKHSVNNSGKLTAGVYFISITIDNKRVVKKLIVN
ncbi:MAG: M43 family zinc metalloprotease [Bacteroidota bacterium]